jgi:hypothetical protein
LPKYQIRVSASCKGKTCRGFAIVLANFSVAATGTGQPHRRLRQAFSARLASFTRQERRPERQGELNTARIGEVGLTVWPVGGALAVTVDRDIFLRIYRSPRGKREEGRSTMAIRTIFAALLLLGIANAPANAGCAGGVSTSIAVTGEVVKPAVFTLKLLEQFAPAQENVSYFAMSGVESNSFTGALLWDVLNSAPVGGIVVNPSVKNDILHKIIVVTGTDCYESVFGAGEVDPFFGGNQMMLAYAENGKSLGENGFAQLIAPGDKAGGRFVYNIATIEVKDAGK